MHVSPLLQRALFVLAMALAGGLVGWQADGHLVSTAVLLVEPVVWVGLSWLVWWRWTSGARSSALTLLAGAGAAALACRLPLQSGEEVGMDEAPFASRLRTCARALPLPAAPVRVLNWTPGETGAELVKVVTDAAADVVVVRARLSEDLVSALAAGVGGEVREFPGDGISTWVFARGVFDACGQSDHWFDRPAPGAELAAVFVQLESGARLPVLIGTMPAPRPVARWSRHVTDARAALHATVNRLESSLLVVALDAPYPLVGPRMTRSLLDTGLVPLFRAPNWPALPVPVHAFDQLWAAEAWLPGEGRSLRASGAARLGQIVELVPRWPVTLPATRDRDPVRHDRDRRVEDLQHHARAE